MKKQESEGVSQATGTPAVPSVGSVWAIEQGCQLRMLDGGWWSDTGRRFRVLSVGETVLTVEVTGEDMVTQMDRVSLKNFLATMVEKPSPSPPQAQADPVDTHGVVVGAKYAVRENKCWSHAASGYYSGHWSYLSQFTVLAVETFKDGTPLVKVSVDRPDRIDCITLDEFLKTTERVVAAPAKPEALPSTPTQDKSAPVEAPAVSVKAKPEPKGADTPVVGAVYRLKPGRKLACVDGGTWDDYGSPRIKVRVVNDKHVEGTVTWGKPGEHRPAKDTWALKEFLKSTERVQPAKIHRARLLGGAPAEGVQPEVGSRHVLLPGSKLPAVGGVSSWSSPALKFKVLGYAGTKRLPRLRLSFFDEGERFLGETTVLRSAFLNRTKPWVPPAAALEIDSTVPPPPVTETEPAEVILVTEAVEKAFNSEEAPEQSPLGEVVWYADLDSLTAEEVIERASVAQEALGSLRAGLNRAVSLLVPDGSSLMGLRTAHTMEEILALEGHFCLFVHPSNLPLLSIRKAPPREHYQGDTWYEGSVIVDRQTYKGLRDVYTDPSVPRCVVQVARYRTDHRQWYLLAPQGKAT